MTAISYSYIRQINKSKEIDNALKDKDAISVGARTYFRSKYNTYQFLNNIGVKTPILYAHYNPLRDDIKLGNGYYFCKPEIGWGSKGIFNLKVENNRYYIDNHTFYDIKKVFQHKKITEPYIIEERIFNKGDKEKKGGITDIKFFCFQNNTAPLCLVINKTKKIRFWLNENAELVHAGIPFQIPDKYLDSQVHTALIKCSDKAAKLFRKIKLKKIRLDFFKLYYKNTKAKYLKGKLFNDMDELSDEIFFNLQNHALNIMQKLPLSFCRIDIFNSTNGVLTNELTPIPGAPILFYPEYDYLLGKQFHESKIIFKNNFENNQFYSSISTLGHNIVYE